jgi:diguanylate cyclase (GGDEF)-like protein
MKIVAELQKRSRTGAEAAERSQNVMLEAWLQDTRTIPSPQTLERSNDEQIQMHAADLLQELSAVLGGEECQGLSWLTPADLVALLRAVSFWRREQGLTTAPASILLPSLTDALLHYQRDELTGLYNRRGFFTLAEQQLKLACRSKRPQVLLFADIDDMKWINDSFGHVQGDTALTDAADVLRQTFRDSDIIARIGGDEFAVLAVEAGQNAEALTTRLEEQLRAHKPKPERPYELSMSMGIAHYNPESPCSLDELMVLADVKMYQQKQEGKNLRQERGERPQAASERPAVSLIRGRSLDPMPNG